MLWGVFLTIVRVGSGDHPCCDRLLGPSYDVLSVSSSLSVNTVAALNLNFAIFKVSCDLLSLPLCFIRAAPTFMLLD